MFPPPIMFCGECSTYGSSKSVAASPPPPSLYEMLFALEEESTDLRRNINHLCTPDNPQEPNDEGGTHSSIPGRNGHAICNVKTRQPYPANVSNAIISSDAFTCSGYLLLVGGSSSPCRFKPLAWGTQTRDQYCHERGIY